MHSKYDSLMKSSNHTLSLLRPTSNSSVLLVLIRSELTAHGSRYVAAERTWTCSKHTLRDRYPASLLARRSDLEKTFHVITIHYCDVIADTENTVSSIVACCTVFTELLPGNSLFKSVTIFIYSKIMLEAI
jgi:hypothetical protein